MKKWLRKNMFYYIGVLCGGTVGYLYYHFIGSKSASSPFTTSPGVSVLWGVVLGLFIVSIFRKEENK